MIEGRLEKLEITLFSALSHLLLARQLDRSTVLILMQSIFVASTTLSNYSFSKNLGRRHESSAVQSSVSPVSSVLSLVSSTYLRQFLARQRLCGTPCMRRGRDHARRIHLDCISASTREV